jgi:hypothetical protein
MTRNLKRKKCTFIDKNATFRNRESTLTIVEKRLQTKCCLAKLDCSETSAGVEWRCIFQDTVDIIYNISTTALKMKLTFDAYPEMPDRQRETAANDSMTVRPPSRRTRPLRLDRGPDALRPHRRHAGFPETAIALASGPGS